jgi:hypothetical protein
MFLFGLMQNSGGLNSDLLGSQIAGMLSLFSTIWFMGINKIEINVSKAINSIETEKVIAFKTVMEKSVEISEPSTIQGFEKFSEKFEAVAKATANVDASRTQSFANLLIATQNLSQAFKVNTTVNVKIGDKKFEAVVEEIVDKKMGDASINGSS